MGIRIRKDQRVFSLDGDNTSYVFGVDETGSFIHLYWGEKMSDLEDFEFPKMRNSSTFDSYMDISSEELSPWGKLRYKEPSLKVEFADGTRDLVLEFVNFDMEEPILTITLIDSFYKIKVQVIYKVFEEIDLIERLVRIHNVEEEKIKIDTIYSGEWNFQGDDFYLTNVHGIWANEGKIFRKQLTAGKVVLESRKGITAHNHSPYFMLDTDANEFKGNVYFGVLAFSGNFKLVAEVLPYKKTRILLGLNDFDSSFLLNKGEILESPSVYFGFSTEGFSGVSNRLNQFSLQHILPKNHRNELRPILYNSWEATHFQVQFDEQVELAKKAAKLGVELFVLDDGWFKNRMNASSGLGDWYPDEKKFPQGLTPLIEKVKNLGMKFGIWVEPEMVNPRSHLYKIHPDWVYGFPNREPTLSRNQLVLNLTKPEVQEYLFYVLDQLLTHHEISFIKWDMNRPFSEPGALNLPLENRQEIWFEHSKQLFILIDKLRQKHPHVIWEGCASGGGRVDYGALQYFDQFWPSDNTDALDRLSIQEGFSYAYPIKTMVSWITDSPNIYSKRSIPLHFRCNASMLGTLGIGCNLNKLTEQDFTIIQNKITHYKKIRPIIQEGNFYRLSSIDENDFHAVQYMKNNKSVLFAFLRGQRRRSTLYYVKFKGLSSETRYCIETNGKIISIKSGDYLMNKGLEIKMIGDYDSQIIEIYPKANHLYKKIKSKQVKF